MSSSDTGRMSAALEEALRVPEPTRTLGIAVWLYVALILAANDRGMAIRTRGKLALDLSVPEPEIDDWLSRLCRAGLIAIKSPSPYLVIILRTWSDVPGPKSDDRCESRSIQPQSREDVPVSGNSSAIAIAIQSSHGDRGPGKGDLRARAREILGLSNEVELDAILRVHSTERVARALERVSRTPDNKIRKSRLALFRYLLGKMNEHTHVPSSTHHPEH
jgi:hypothetical protein